MNVSQTKGKTVDNGVSLMKSTEIAEVIKKQAPHSEAKISTRNLSFFYGNNQALFENNLEIATNTDRFWSRLDMARCAHC